MPSCSNKFKLFHSYRKLTDFDWSSKGHSIVDSLGQSFGFINHLETKGIRPYSHLRLNIWLKRLPFKPTNVFSSFLAKIHLLDTYKVVNNQFSFDKPVFCLPYTLMHLFRSETSAYTWQYQVISSSEGRKFWPHYSLQRMN